MIHRLNVFILHRYPYREEGWILKCLSEEKGIFSCFAKQAKRLKTLSQFEPFHLVELEYFESNGFNRLRSIERSSNECVRLPLQGERLFCGFYLAELILNLIPESFSHSFTGGEVFRLYQVALEALFEVEQLEPILRVFEIELLKLLGVWPDFSKDARGNPLLESAYYEVCPGESPRCLSETGEGIDPEKKLYAFLGKELQWIASWEWDEPSVLKQAKQILRAWIDYYSAGKTFKTRECLMNFYRVRAVSDSHSK